MPGLLRRGRCRWMNVLGGGTATKPPGQVRSRRLCPGSRSGYRTGLGEDQYPLKTLLGLRRREEDLAEQAWAKATQARREAEAEAEERAVVVRALAERLGAARAAQRFGGKSGPSSEVATASEVVAVARFEARLRDELARATALRDAHARGTLATARVTEERAQAELLAKRRAREALATHEGRFAAEERRESERRADDENDEYARVTRHARGSAPDPEG